MSILNISAIIKDYFGVELTEEKRFLKVRAHASGFTLEAVEIKREQLEEKIGRKQEFLTALIEMIRSAKQPLSTEGISDSKELKKLFVANCAIEKMVERKKSGERLFEQCIKLIGALENLKGGYSTFHGNVALPRQSSSVAERKEELAKQLPHLEQSASPQLEQPAPPQFEEPPPPQPTQLTSPQLEQPAPSLPEQSGPGAPSSSRGTSPRRGEERKSLPNPLPQLDLATQPEPAAPTTNVGHTRKRSNSLIVQSSRITSAASQSQSTAPLRRPSLSASSSRPPSITHIPTMRYKSGNLSEDHKAQLAAREEAYSSSIAKLPQDILVCLEKIWFCSEKKQKDKQKHALKEYVEKYNSSLVEEVCELAGLPLMRLAMQKSAADLLARPLRGVHDPLALTSSTFINLNTLAHNLLRQSFHIKSNDESRPDIPTSRESDSKTKFEIETTDFTWILTKILDRFPIENREPFQQAVIASWKMILGNSGEIADDSGPLAVETLLNRLKKLEIESLEKNEANQAACDNLVYLLRAFSQDLYMDPLNEIKGFFNSHKFVRVEPLEEKSKEVEKKEDKLDDFLFEYTLNADGNLKVECVSELTYSYKQLFNFTLYIRHQLLSSMSALPRWDTHLRMIIENIIPTSGKAVKKESYLREQMKVLIVKPLFELGFSVEINDKSFTDKKEKK